MRQRFRSPSWIVSTTLFLVVGGLWLVFLRPPILGGDTTYTIVSGESMEPTLWTGDLAVVRQQAGYEPGDVVAFRTGRSDSPRGPVVVHRIIGGSSAAGYVLQGDNNEEPDPWQPTGDEVVGEMWFHVPGAGDVLLFVAQPIVLASILGGVTVFFILLGPSRARARPGNERAPTRRSWRPAVRLGTAVVVRVAAVALLVAAGSSLGIGSA